jgi:hypothetical protein
MISGFQREVYEIYDIPGYCVAYGGNSFPTFLGQLIGPIFKGK